MVRKAVWIVLGFACFGFVVTAGIMPLKVSAEDARLVIQVSSETQEGVKAEMVDILLALQTIVNKTLEGDGSTIAEAIKPFTTSGVRGHPEIAMFLSNYPDMFTAWRQMGRNGMHATFDRIESLASIQPLDKEAMLEETGTLLGYCYGCHMTFTLP